MRKPLSTDHRQLSTINLPSYNGGKSGDGVYQTIINHIPPIASRLIIGCLGHCGILRNIRPAPFNIGIDTDAAVIERWEDLKLPSCYGFLNEDIIQYLKEGQAHLGAGDFIYLDPPYEKETRKGKRDLYKYEWVKEQHIELLETVTMYRNGWDNPNIAISCYDSPLYQKYLEGWNKIQFTAQTRRGPATETLYFNYPFPTELHDYRYIGKDYRERENIAKKIKRHVRKLKELPILERNAIIYALNDQVSSVPVPDRKICANCNQVFTPRTTRAVYCSTNCRVKSYRSRA